MASVKIISVNPAQKTLGALHPELTERLKRKARFQVKIGERKLKDDLNLVFGINGGMSKINLRRLSMLRVMAGLYFVLFFSLQLISGFSIPATLWVAIGSFMLLGLFTRFASIAGIGVALFSLISYSVFPVLDSGDCLSLFVCLIFSIFGGGYYSLDAFLRRRIFRSVVNRRIRKRIERSLSYKAFAYSCH